MNGALNLDVKGGLVATAEPVKKGPVLKPDQFRLRNITAHDGLLQFHVPAVDATGTVTFEKGVVSLQLHDVSGPALTIADTLNPEGDSVASTLEFHRVTGTNVSVAGGLNKFSANGWDTPAGGGPGGLLSARFINELDIRKGNRLAGDFAAGIGVTGPAPNGGAGLGTVNIDGAVRSATWNIGLAGVGGPISVRAVTICVPSPSRGAPRTGG